MILRSKIKHSPLSTLQQTHYLICTVGRFLFQDSTKEKLLSVARE